MKKQNKSILIIVKAFMIICLLYFLFYLIQHNLFSIFFDDVELYSELQAEPYLEVQVEEQIEEQVEE